jgi:cell division protein FtsN/nucleoid DNA-binding protein
MVIEKYISDLLYKHDCVIIPGLGGFVANYRKAGIDLHKQEFYPPARILAFNAELNKSDGLLINYISKCESLSYEKVADQIDLFAKQTLFTINEGKKIELDNLGVLWSEEGRIQFEPEMKQNFLLDSYGLSSFNYPILKDQKKPKIIRTAKIEEVKESTSNSFEKETEKVRLSKGTYRRSWLIGIPTAAALIAVVVFSFTRDKAFEHKINQANFNPVVVNEQPNRDKTPVKDQTKTIEEEPVVIANTEDVVAETEEFVEPEIEPTSKETAEINEPEITPEPETVTQAEPQKIEIPANTDNNRYYVIAGSFGYADNANVCKNRLQESGYPAKVHNSGNGKFRVSLMAFPDMQDAINELESLRNASGNPDLWVLYM